MTYADTTATVQEIGRELRLIRTAQGRSVFDAATRTGIGTATVEAIEAGYTTVPLHTWLRYAQALGCTLRLTAGGDAS